MAQDRDGTFERQGLRTVSGAGAKPAGRLTGRARHTEPGWFEWILRELVRYFFLLFLLGVAMFGPLQMEYSWLPDNQPPVLNPAIVAILAGAYLAGLVFFAYHAYRYMWGEDGYVDRLVDRHFERLSARPKTDDS